MFPHRYTDDQRRARIHPRNRRDPSSNSISYIAVRSSLCFSNNFKTCWAIYSGSERGCRAFWVGAARSRLIQASITIGATQHYSQQSQASRDDERLPAMEWVCPGHQLALERPRWGNSILFDITYNSLFVW